MSAQSEGFTAVRIAAMREVGVRDPGERFAVVIGRDGPTAVVSELRREPDWSMSWGHEGAEPPPFSWLVAAVRGMGDGIWAAAWVRITDGGGAEVLVEDLDPPFSAERLWSVDRTSQEWQSEPAAGLLPHRHLAPHEEGLGTD